MRFLKKISPSPYADSIHGVIAYSGEEDYRDQLDLWAQGDAETQARRDEAIAGFQEAMAEREAERELAQSLEYYQRQLCIQEAHEDAADIVAVSAAGGVILGGGTGALIGGGVAAYAGCYKSCHDQSPPSGCNDGGG